MSPDPFHDSRARRDAALRRLRRVNGAIAAGALGLVLLLTSAAAHAFPGHSRSSRRPAPLIRVAPARHRHHRTTARPAATTEHRTRHRRRPSSATHPPTTSQTASTAAPAPLSPPATAPQPAPAPSSAPSESVTSGGS